MKVKTLAQKPTILVVSFNKKLIQVFRLVSHDVAGVDFEFVDFYHNKFLNLKNNDYYKIIWLASLEDIINFNPQKNKDIIDVLARVNIPLNIVYFVPARIKLNQKKLDLVSIFLKKEQQFLDHINQTLITPQIIRGCEVVDANLTILPISSLVLLLKHLDSGVIIKPTSYLSYLDVDDFFQTSINLVLKPHTARVVTLKSSLNKKAEEIFTTLERVYGYSHKRRLVIKNTNIVVGCSREQNTIVIKSNFSFKLKILAQNLSKRNIGLIKKKNQELEAVVETTRSLVKEKEASQELLLKISRQPAKTQALNKSAIGSVSNIEGFNLDKLILAEVSKERKKSKQKYIKTLSRVEDKGKKKNKRRKALFFGGITMLSVGTLISVLIVGYVFTQTSFKNSLRKNIINAVDDASVNYHQPLWFNLLRLQTNFYQRIITTNQIDSSNELIKFAAALNQLSQNIKKINTTVNDFVVATLSKNNQLSKLPVKNIDSLKTPIEESLLLLNNVLEQVDRVGLELGLNNSSTDELKTTLKQEQKSLKLANKLIPIASDIFTSSSPKNIFLVYVDNHELRSVGGVVGATALLTFNDNSLSGYKVFTSGEIDQKLAGVIAPPETLQSKIGEKEWFFNDAGWETPPNRAVDRIAWFLNKSTEIKPDGVVIITNDGLKNILKVFGEVELKQYNETITSKNLDEKLLFHDQAEPLKTIEYRRKLLRVVLDEITKIKSDSGIKLVREFGVGLNKQQVVLSEFKETSQSVFDSLFWSGKLITQRCPSLFSNKTCQAEIYAQIENNFGLNKANYFLTKNIRQTVTLNNKIINHERRVIYNNLAKTNTWPKGDYHALVTIYLPKESNDIQIKIDNRQPPLEIKKTNDYKLVSFDINVPIDSKVELDVNFTTSLLANENLSYLFFDQNQPGSKANPYQFKLINNLNKTPKLIAPKTETNLNTYTFNLVQDKNLLFAFKF